MSFLKLNIILTFILTFALTIAKSQDLTTENSVENDFAFLFQNAEKNVQQNAQAIVIPNSKQSFSGFDAAKAYSHIDNNKNYKNIYFVYSDENSKLFEKHKLLIQTYFGREITIIPIVINSAKKDSRINELLTKNNLVIISEDIANQIISAENFNKISLENKKGSVNSNWKILVRK